MTCRDVSELLSSYLDDELEPEVCNLVENHLRSCDACRAELEELRQVKLALKSLPELEPPPSLHSRVMDAVRDQHRVKKQKLTALLENLTGEGSHCLKKFSKAATDRAGAGLIVTVSGQHAGLVGEYVLCAGNMLFVRYLSLDHQEICSSLHRLRSMVARLYRRQHLMRGGVSRPEHAFVRGAAQLEEPQASSSENP